MTELTTQTEELQVRVEDGVCVLTMNRPERRNALTGGMLTALADAAGHRGPAVRDAQAHHRHAAGGGRRGRARPGSCTTSRSGYRPRRRWRWGS
jgi:hypothetical protein